MFNTQKSMDKLKAALIKALGQDDYDSNIVDIADMINDLDYKEANISIKSAVMLIKEVITDKTKKYWRQIFKNEFANHDFHKAPQFRKWRWLSSSEKIKFLTTTSRLKESGVSWKKIGEMLHVSAVDMVNNILYGKVFANELQRFLAHKIWEHRVKKCNLWP